MQEQRIYLDFNATTPIAPEVADAIQQALIGPFGNPSSGHWAGLPARQALGKARARVAALLHCNLDEIVFTSGGSESNNHALKGAFVAHGGRGGGVGSVSSSDGELNAVSAPTRPLTVPLPTIDNVVLLAFGASIWGLGEAVWPCTLFVNEPITSVLPSTRGLSPFSA